MTEDPPPLHWVEIERRVLVECTHEVVGLHPRRRDGIADAVVHQRRGKDHRVVLVAEDAAQRDEEDHEGFEPRRVLLQGVDATPSTLFLESRNGLVGSPPTPEAPSTASSNRSCPSIS